MRKYFITGIGTEVGKTIASAVVCKALGAAYWKPIQVGFPRDYDTVSELVGKGFTGFPEAYLLSHIASPNISAKKEGISIEKEHLHPPAASCDLVIEGAGGGLVPFNDTEYMLDIATFCKADLIIVVKLYLGCINHTLMMKPWLANHKVAGFIVNGPNTQDAEDMLHTLLQHMDYPVLLRMYTEKEMNASVIAKYAHQFPKISTL